MAELVSQPTSIQSIYTWFRNDQLFVNRRYQRKLVWTLEEKQKLVESILKKYPIPAILVAEREGYPGTYEIIDGLQRLHAIVSFIETTYPTLEGSFFNLDLFPTAKSHAQEGFFEPTVSTQLLGQGEVSTILDYSLALSVMRNASEEEINDVFDRINTYGHRLSDQERRQAGVQSDFSNLVREISCSLRGDVSDEILTLSHMPSISIDLPMTKHGYEVQADEVFWVQEGVLRSTDLRDSLDEQCIADIAACVIGGRLIPRTKDALDELYNVNTDASRQLSDALEVYGSDKFAEEFKYIVDTITEVPDEGEKLRDVIFSKRTTNAFPSVFAVIALAFHELIVSDQMTVSDLPGLRKAMDNLVDRIEGGRKAGSPEERRKNVDTVKGLISGCFVKSQDPQRIYGGHSVFDIDGLLRRSEAEVSHYELKQGMLSLADTRKADEALVEKVLKTVCAIANNGPDSFGKILIGVTDKSQDAQRIKELDGIEPKRVGHRFVVGVNREAKVLGVTVEDYLGSWKDAIRNSGLSDELKASVLSNIDFHNFYGLGLIVITIPPQKDISYFEEEVYWREMDSTKRAESAKEISAIAKRFVSFPAR